MLSISHAATGAVLASRVSNPWLAIPLILAAHYLEDAVPHWDAGTGLGKGTKAVSHAFRDGLIDLCLAGLLILLMYPAAFPIIQDSRFIIRDSAPIWGAFFGLLPDFLEVPRNFFHTEPALLRPLNRFHHAFHHSIPHPLAGLLPQLFLLILLWLLR